MPIPKRDIMRRLRERRRQERLAAGADRTRPCVACGTPLQADARADARTCSARCRKKLARDQAHRPSWAAAATLVAPMQADDGDNAAARAAQRKSAPQREPGVVVDALVDVGVLGAATERLLRNLDEARRTSSATEIRRRDKGGRIQRTMEPPKLRASREVVRALGNFAMALGPIAQKACLPPVVDLLRALDSLGEGRGAPDWLRHPKSSNRSRDPDLVWRAKVLAAAALQAMLNAGVPLLQARDEVRKVLIEHGIKVSSKEGKGTTPYRWLVQCRPSGDAPPEWKAAFEKWLADNLAPYRTSSKARSLRAVPRWLSRALTFQSKDRC